MGMDIRNWGGVMGDIEVLHFGIGSLIPVLVVIGVAIKTHRTFEPLLLGAVVGYVFLEGWMWFPAFLQGVYTVLADQTTIWIVLVCGLFGSLIKILEESGSAAAFSSRVQGRLKNQRVAVLGTWAMGLVLFMDDYLNVLTVGSTMKKVTDNYGVPRAVLAYMVNVTAASVCVLVPLSTWAAFMTGQLLANGLTVYGNPSLAYLRTIPFMVYPLVSVVMVPLFVLGVFPGPARLRVSNKSTIVPSAADYAFRGSASIDQAINSPAPLEKQESGERPYSTQAIKKNGGVRGLVLPMVVLALITIIWDDMLAGVIGAIGISGLLFIPMGIMKAGKFFDSIIEGFKSMIPVLFIIVAAFILQQANEALGLTPFVIEASRGLLVPALLPAFSFILVGVLAFTTGSFWGVAALVFPIVLPLAVSLGVHPFLTAGAIISGTILGSNGCFYGDAVSLTCSATGITNIQYGKTALPGIMLQASFSLVVFILLGFLL